MKRIFTIIIISVSLVSCITQKHCNELYPCEAKDSIITKEYIEYYTDTFVKWLPVDTAKIMGLVKCDSSGKAHLTEITVISNRGKASASVTDGILKVNAICLADSLQAIVTVQNKTIETLKEKLINQKPITVYKIPWYMFVFVGLLIVALILSFFKF
jgi:hypothetical protein